MERVIYEVHMAYVNAAGYHASDPEGYPKVIDSKNHNNDVEMTKRAAYGYLGAAESYLATRDNQVGYAYIIRSNDGFQIEKRVFGKIAALPDPEPEPEQEG